jgi:tetratricopeptide (TPR) repeat protein
MRVRFFWFVGAAIVVALTLTGTAGERRWTLINGRNVTIAGQQSPKALRRIAVELEQFRAALGSLVGQAGQPPPTLVYVFDNHRALEPFVPLSQGRPAALDGYCHCGAGADINFIAASLTGYTGASAIIFHEYTHLFLSHAVRSLPVWLNEGLAEYYSTFRLTDDGRRVVIGSPVEPHVNAVRGRYIPVADLLAVDQASALYDESDRRSVFYAEAWLLTHYLLVERPNGAEAVGRYLHAVANGRPASQVFLEAFGLSPSEMDSALRRYRERPTFRSRTYELPARLGVDEPDRERTMPAAEAEARLGDVQLRVGRLDEAAVRIEAAAAAGPDVAPAQLTLALMRLGQNKEAEAWLPLQKAAALAPSDFLTQYVLALSLLRKEIGTTTEDPRELAHAALTRALAANPRSTDALAWQAYVDLELDTRIPEARAAIARAVELAPDRLDYRLRLAEVCLRQGERSKARRLLTELAIATGDDRAVTRAKVLLAQIDRESNDQISP